MTVAVVAAAPYNHNQTTNNTTSRAFKPTHGTSHAPTNNAAAAGVEGTMAEIGDHAAAATGPAVAANDRKPHRRSERTSKNAGTAGAGGSGKRRDKSSKRKTDVTNGTRARSLKKSTSMSCMSDLQKGSSATNAEDPTLLPKSASVHKESRKSGRRRTASVEPVGGTKSKSRSRSSSPRRSLASGLQDLGDDPPNNGQDKPSSTDGSSGPATAETAATASLASSSLDASEKQQRKRNKSKEGSRRRNLGEAATTGERRSSRRNLIDASARKQTSRRTLSDGSNKEKKALLMGGPGVMPDASQALDGSRVSSSSMEASIKDSTSGFGMAGGSKRRNLLDAARERPSMRDVSSRRKMMAESSERHSSSKDMRQQQTRRHSNEAERQMRRNSNEAAPSTRRNRGTRASSSRKLSVERTGSSGRRTPSQRETAEDIPEMKQFDTATSETRQEHATNTTNSGPVEGAFDDMGFPTTAAPESAASTKDADNVDDFGNLPDFPVSDFSFGDLNFPLFDSNFDTKDLKVKDDIKVDNAKAEEISSKEEAKKKLQEKQQAQSQQKQKQESAAPESASASASRSVASASKSKLPPGHWICDNCQEEHDESDLHFCGMCGTDRPKQKETSPRPKRSIRRSSTMGGGSTKRDGSKKTVRRSNTMQSQQHQEEAGGAGGGGRSTGSPKRPASTVGLRKVRSRDKSGLTTTPRSRSKGKVRPSSVGSRDKDVSLIVKCLDGGEGEAMDMEMLNQQLTTFDSLEAPPPTPMRKKKSIRRSKSDVSEEHRVGRTPTSSAPQTPRSLGKKKIPVQRSKSYEPGNDPPLQIPRNSIRQAIPRRAKSSTTEYLQQLQQTKKQLDLEISAHGAIHNNANLSGTATDELKTQSAHSIGGQPQGATAARPTTLAGMRQAMMKSASSRILGGISGIASSTFTIGGVTNVTGMISPFSKPKGDAFLLNSDDEGDDNDEFASEPQQKAAPEETVMLRDFSSTPSNRNLDVSSQPRPRRLSSRNLMANQDDDGGVPQTPRRRRASVATARQAALANRDADGVTRTPRRRARPSSASRMSKRGGGLPLTDDEDKKSVGSGALDYDDIDIDEGNGEDVESTSGDLGYGFTPRRTRERLARPMPRRQGAGGSLVSRSDHGAVTPKGLNARSRIRRASIAGFAVGPLPDLDNAPDPPKEKAPPTPGTLKARSRLRRASLGAAQAPEADPSIPAPKLLEESELPPGSGHGSRVPRGGRPGRAGRRGSVENPMLQQALAHMPQDPTHAVRSDLQEEWKRQEQLEDMRKKAKNMHGRYGAGSLGGAAHAGADPLFQPEFSEFGQASGGGEDVDEGEESGADLELAGDEDVSDLSSNDGDPMG